MKRSLAVVDVFGAEAGSGNPVAVVLDGEDLDTAQMQRFARWMNLSETTFVLPPSGSGADYRVRIFTPAAELPFAGHPTLGTCHAWLAAGGATREPGVAVQECGAGLVPVRQTEREDGSLAFAAPPVLRDGPVEDELLDRIAGMLAVSRADIVDAEWADNGPGWVAVLLKDADAVLAARPAGVDIDLGLAGLYPPGSEAAVEVRAFFPVNGSGVEDPVTGSLNASLAAWLLRTGRLTAPYVASQGTVIGRRGRVQVSADAAGAIWVGGRTATLITGEADL
jgi:PhzF family phenazine biosynthesis protein